MLNRPKLFSNCKRALNKLFFLIQHAIYFNDSAVVKHTWMRKSLDPDSISDFRLDTDPERMYITNTDPKHLAQWLRTRRLRQQF